MWGAGDSEKETQASDMSSRRASIEPKTFEADCREAVLSLRASLLDLYRTLNADPAAPQDVSRRFKLNKNLTWKISRLIQSEEPLQAIPMIPGGSGMAILLRAFEDDAPSEVVEQVRVATQRFEHMVTMHVGDRANLELMLDSVANARPLDTSRKLAFRGAAGIWGVLARARVTAAIIAPSAEQPGMLDVAFIGGLVGVRRLRDIASWPVFNIRDYRDDGTHDERPAARFALSARDEPDNAWLMREFCSGTLPDFTVRRHKGIETHLIGPGPVGKTGEFTCFFGYAQRAAVPAYRDADNSRGEFGSMISMPVESMLLDVFTHHSLPEALDQSVALFGTPGFGPEHTGEPIELPNAERSINLGKGPRISTPLVPGYEELINAAMHRCGWNHRDFYCSRVISEHPPMGATLITRYPLPERPA